MISYLNGTLSQIDKTSIVVEVSGIGYLVKVASSTLVQLPKIGEKLKIHTCHIVREDDVSLYGFLTSEEKSIFMLLLSVNGIGPKASMSILSAFPISQLVSAITSANVSLISTVPGIGSKTAQKLVIELKEKMAKQYALKSGELDLSANDNIPNVNDAVSALISLGYSSREAKEALQKTGLDIKTADIETLVKSALKALV